MSEESDMKQTITLALDIEKVVDQVARYIMGYVYDEEGDVDFGDVDFGEGDTPPRHKRATIKEMVLAVVMKRTKDAVDEAIKTITTPIIEEAVAAVLADGWYKTNDYGEKTGTKLDLQGRIAAMLTERQGSFNDRGTYIDGLVKKHVDDAMQKQLAPLVEQAKKSLKDQLDAGIAAKFAEVVKQTLGVPR